MEQKNIIKDSIKTLAFIYKKGKTNSSEIIKESGYDEEHFFDIIDYLEGECLIKTPIRMASADVINIRCDTEGIKAIEQPNSFQGSEGDNIKINVTNVNIDSIFKTDSIFQGKIF